MEHQFIWDENKEPHFQRRINILKDFPKVKSLFGIDKTLKFKALALVIVQLALPVFLQGMHWAVIVAALFFVSATICHALFLAIHEITHDLAFRRKSLNNWLAIITNFPIIFPYAMAFKVYHQEHHWHQGTDGVDVDIPAEKEALLFKGKLGKSIWLVNQILFYALRPMIVKPIKPTKWMIGNMVIQLTFTALYLYFFGWFPVFFLVISIFISGGLHPVAGHFISEHYVVEEGQETYSYYGPLNRVAFNVGYHNEHHDFPNIPGSRLPKLKEMAAPYYNNLHECKSWSKLLLRFVFDKNITLFSRIKRSN